MLMQQRAALQPLQVQCLARKPHSSSMPTPGGGGRASQPRALRKGGGGVGGLSSSPPPPPPPAPSPPPAAKQQQQQQQLDQQQQQQQRRREQQRQEQRRQVAAEAARRRQALPGDSGWDVLRLRKAEPRAFARLREVELIHSRWAMLGTIALLVGDASGASPFPPREATLAALAPWGAVLLLLLGLAESYRLAALWGVPEEDVDARLYPGGPRLVGALLRRLMGGGDGGVGAQQQQQQQQQRGKPSAGSAARGRGSSSGGGGGGGGRGTDASADADADAAPALGVFAPWLGGAVGWLAGGWWFDARGATRGELLDMRSRELRNGRLAMVSFVGVVAAAALTGRGPLTLLAEHLADPVHHTVVTELLQRQ